MGTRRMVQPMEWRPRIFQKGSLLRRISTDGRESGIRQRPRRSMRWGGRTLEEDSSGTYVFKSRFRKSKMLCLAGLTPVAKVDQATGESAGKVVRSLL